jgi:hypothetical protein
MLRRWLLIGRCRRFHLSFGRAEVAFGLVSGEGDGEIAGEAQHVGLPVAQAFQEVAGLGLFAAGSRWVFGQTDEDGVSPGVQQWVGNLRRDLRSALVPGVVGGGVEREQGVDGLAGPVLAGIGFAGGEEFAGDVRPAQGMVAVGVGVVGGPAIVHRDTGEAGENAELVIAGRPRDLSR